MRTLRVDFGSENSDRRRAGHVGHSFTLCILAALLVFGATVSHARAEVLILAHEGSLSTSGSRVCPEDGITYEAHDAESSNVLGDLRLLCQTQFDAPCGAVLGGSARLDVTFVASKLTLTGYARAESGHVDYEVAFRVLQPTLVSSHFFHSVGGQGSGGGSGSFELRRAGGQRVRLIDSLEDESLYEDILEAGDYTMRMAASYTSSAGNGTTYFSSALSFDGLVVSSDAVDISTLKSIFSR